jgi:hypothetical protein
MAPLGARRRRAPGGFLPGAVVPRVCGGETLANSDTRAEMTYRTLGRTGGWSTRWSGSRRTASTWCSTMKSRFEDPDRIFREDGAQEALLEAKQAGKPRYIGFTGHEDPRIHLAWRKHGGAMREPPSWRHSRRPWDVSRERAHG